MVAAQSQQTGQQAGRANVPAGHQQFRCTGDCFRCQPLQRQYCAAQWSYNSMRMLESMQEAIEAMHGTVEELKVKVDAIQGNEASLFDPTGNAAAMTFQPKGAAEAVPAPKTQGTLPS